MSNIITAPQFAELFINDTPLLDVRAPVEYQRGAFPSACNLPLLDDEQRRLVGIRYKQAGQQAAIDLGHDLVSGSLREQRLQSWQAFIDRHPDAVLYCFRGGLRSRVVAEWLHAEGIRIPRIRGGYKALRRYLIDFLDRSAERQPCIVVAGKTGCAKTHLINQLAASIDLEGCANHRGSAFGTRIDGQPGQINFENRLAIAMLKVLRWTPAHLFLEDESRAIGSLSIPTRLFERMKTSPLAVIEESVQNRVETILDDYIRSNYREFVRADPASGEQRFREFLNSGLAKIRRRLGPDNYALVAASMERALQRQQGTGDTDDHRQWIEQLLTHYYDPMYEFQLRKKQGRIVFRGNRQEFLDWATHLDSHDLARQS